ncbi:MAG TPA: helix-turn-helix transcriptional regulator [Pseudonocardiaceae bacterium]|nr:helix-turn-helix transcriptional regulator [Pseudonocardiaceae bacterium]
MRDDDWDAVAKAVRDRMAELDMTQKELVRRSRVSESTIRQVSRNYGPRKRSRHTLEDISKGLQWPSDHLTRILDGGGTRFGPDVDHKVQAEIAELHAAVADIRESLAVLASRVEKLEHGQ